MQGLDQLMTRERASTAEILLHLGEIEARRLYLAAGCDGMYHYCVRVLHLSSATAFRRVHAARAARRFPKLFDAVADGRLHVTAVVVLAPCLRPENLDELIGAATHRTRREIESWLVRRFPAEPAVADEPCHGIEAAPRTAQNPSFATGPLAPAQVVPSRSSLDAQVAEPLAASIPEIPRTCAPVVFVPPVRHVALSAELEDLLQEARELLGHSLPSGETIPILERAVREMNERLRGRKFGLTPRPRTSGHVARGRHIPAAIRRAVWARDGGRCTFEGDSGVRCETRTRLEYDHSRPVAKGGQTTVENLRLRCRAHDQYAAEQAFGTGFMREKRERARAARRARAAP